ncbi:MAG TPA: FAD-binding oxidoreductase [Gammaproteobacteria bacterium]|nr:FAD-binding oxidoreductase [Gammaproteobacteria bacterium]
MDYSVTVLMTELVTHDVRRYIVERPAGFELEPGQAVMLALNAAGWEKVRRSFTPTSLPADRVLEFTIKAYPDHPGLTRALHGLGPGTELRMSRPFGTLTYRGPGTFIAGGAGITPFLAMIRSLAGDGAAGDHGLIYAARTPDDLICPQELRHYLGERCRLVCTREGGTGCEPGRVDRDYLARALDTQDQHFYVCGPPAFVRDVTAALDDLGASADLMLFES